MLCDLSAWKKAGEDLTNNASAAHGEWGRIFDDVHRQRDAFSAHHCYGHLEADVKLLYAVTFAGAVVPELKAKAERFKEKAAFVEDYRTYLETHLGAAKASAAGTK